MAITPETRAIPPASNRLLNWLSRHPVWSGFLLMFACTWPIDLWAAASSHGWTSHPVPPTLALLVGYGFVVAALAMTAILDGRAGVGLLLRRFLVWRVGALWFGVVLLGPAVIDLAAIAIDVLMGGAVPNFEQPFARQLVGPGVSLWFVLPLFLLIGVFTNGEEIGWRGYALPRLQARHSALVASLVVGLASVLWHIPKFLTAGSAQDYPFWIFLLDNLAKAIIFTWVFNSTRGSLLTVTLLHAALNTSAVFLPILPAATGDQRALMISVGLHCLVAIVIVIVAGPARLTRSPITSPKIDTSAPPALQQDK